MEDVHFDSKEASLLKGHFASQNASITPEYVCSIMSKYFPFGDCTKFSNILVKYLQRSKLGSPETYIDFWSLSSRGNLEERIDWLFAFFDLDQDDVISLADLEMLCDAISSMTCGFSQLGNLSDLVQYTQDLYNSSLPITKQTFSEAIRTRPDLLKGVLLFNGLL